MIMLSERNISIETDYIYPIKIGEKGVLIQVNETAICIGRIIIDFYNKNDDSTNMQWLVGGVFIDNSKEFFLCLVKNGSVLEKYILLGSNIIPDGHLSYPVACRKLNFTHFVVNHTEGFINDDGYITNQAKNLWNQIKKYYKMRDTMR